MKAFELLDGWPVPSYGAAVVDADGMVHTAGQAEHGFAIASVTKPLAALVTMVAVEEGLVELDTPAGPPRSTVEHLLAHASGLAPDQRRLMTEPGTRRIYSNSGFEVLGETVAAQAQMSFEEYFHEALEPLGLSATVLRGSPAHGAISSAADLAVVARMIAVPDGRLLDPTTVDLMCTPAFAEISGVLPGYGLQDPNPWGLGLEIRGAKSPHWTARASSADTVGHFGRAGGFMWIDRPRRVAAIVLTDRDFGDWALDRWPEFSDAVLDELGV